MTTLEHAPLPATWTGDSARLSLLSPREHEVLRLVASGLSNAEVAESLVISVATVKTHLAQLLRKLRARDRVALVVLAWRDGVISAPGRETPALPTRPAHTARRRCPHRSRW